MFGKNKHINSQTVFMHAAANALVAVAYITSVVFIMENMGKILGPEGKAPTFLGPVAFLLLFVISATVMGITIFGRPILWYLEKKTTEAFMLLAYTLGMLVLILGLIVITLILQVA